MTEEPTPTERVLYAKDIDGAGYIGKFVNLPSLCVQADSLDDLKIESAKMFKFWLGFLEKCELEMKEIPLSEWASEFDPYSQGCKAGNESAERKFQSQLKSSEAMIKKLVDRHEWWMDARKKQDKIHGHNSTYYYDDKLISEARQHIEPTKTDS